MGSCPVSSKYGYLYYAIFVDDFSRFTWLYPLRRKYEFYNVFLQFQKFVETQFSVKIKVFQTDGGTEFTNKRLQAHLLDCGIHHQLSCPSTAEQNGRAERKHRHITETGLSMLFHTAVPLCYWLEAFSSAVFIINRLPTPLLGGKSPFELVYGLLPDYSVFHPFGCRVYPCIRATMAHKFSP